LHKHFAKAELGEIVAAGAERVAAPCPHYVHDRCGGCQLQHLAYDAQLAAKRAIVGDALRRIGKLDVPDPEIVEAVEEWRYRAKVSLTVMAGGPATGFPATAFEPVHPEMALLARRWAVEQLGDLRGGVAWDLYGGIGDAAVELAGRGAQVASVDVDEAAVEWARGRASERP